MLGRIELVCNQSWVSDKVVLRARGQNNRPLWGGTATPTDLD
ncbi:hypothetical protein ACFQHW_09935 [Lapidilactobacillus achengensis]|uniref:Uncharacterized protein n=1 Tax=Lapidilactobacillus achengensis TaxID=2486000 RepID=A0ABW1UTB0_9LACO